MPKIKPARVIEPRIHPLKIQAERNGGEILHGKDFTGPEIGVGSIHFDRTGLNRIEPFESRNQFTGGEMLNVQTPIGHFRHTFTEIFRAARTGDIKWRPRTIGVGHFPVKGFLCARNVRSGDNSGPGCCCTDCRLGEKVAAFNICH